MLVRVLIAIGGALLVSWLALVLFVLVTRPERGRLAEGLRLLPDTVRLLRRVAADRSVRRGVRVRLWLLFAYLASPIDLVPDFVPVLGYADDAIIVSLVLRSVVRRAGAPAVRRHWPGTDDGLGALSRLTRLRLAGPPSEPV